MNEKNFPNWMLVAVVFGFGELTYWMYNHWGICLQTEISFGSTVIVAIAMLGVYVLRLVKRAERDRTSKKEL